MSQNGLQSRGFEWLRTGLDHGMFLGTVGTSKITITLPSEQIEEIRALVANGRSASVSAFAKHAIAVGLQDAAGCRLRD